MSVEEQNIQLVQTLDDAWNTQDLETFNKRHKPDVSSGGPDSRRRTGAKP